MGATTSQQIPIACSLEATDFNDRISWIVNLNRGALLRSRRDDLQLELTYEARAIAEVRELVRREQECCAFLSFRLHEDEDVLRLVISAPDGARDAIELLFERFQSKGPIADVSCGCGSGYVERPGLP